MGVFVLSLVCACVTCAEQCGLYASLRVSRNKRSKYLADTVPPSVSTPLHVFARMHVGVFVRAPVCNTCAEHCGIYVLELTGF